MEASEPAGGVVGGGEIKAAREAVAEVGLARARKGGIVLGVGPGEVGGEGGPGLEEEARG